MATLSLVDPRQVPQVWPTAYPLLAEAIERSNGRYTEATVYRDCLAGQYSLWLILESGLIGALVTQIVVWPSGLREGMFVVVGGENHQAWVPLLREIEKWIKSQGCSRISVCGRPGWEREIGKLPGWKKTGVEMEKDLARN